MSVDKVDNQTIECMVCASCTFKGEKRQEERKIDRSEGEGVREMSKRKKLNCRKIVKTVLEKTAGMRRRWTMRLREDVAGSFIGNCAGRDKDLCTKC